MIPPKAPGRAPLFLTAADTIRVNIKTGRLDRGQVLLEGPLAERLKISRSSVKRALGLLEEEGAIRRFDGRGYVVGPPDDDTAPIRSDLKSIPLIVDEAHDETLNRPNWKRIHDQVEADVSACLVFGQFRIVESELAAHFAVSRTVIRDVLGRLQERGLVTKSSTSRWLVAPLTAQSIKNKFELRIILEVAALRSAAPFIDRIALERICRSMAEAEAEGRLVHPNTWFSLVNEFVDMAILSTPNEDLRQLISANMKTLQASQNALFGLGLFGDALAIREIRMIGELIIVGSTASAAEMLESHLSKSRDRTIAQLKLVAVLPQPGHIAPYLIPA
ncbi:GntR family transcriptional regulator [Aliihoeflea sp. 40Bstr573]|uniref:GntR family transcriptional regulator n=1 Tax=Aliihoeflea sp. 40Bstr573 TaxID=2696467 RepID=UPI0020961E6D|nr:GntR family transcriptional regulator [Aliihoeflea sp. 40Bstr573]MCO6386475.1 GntR family transcriptional regulator [Aliihoeflea sp. 40Bstr573]